MQFSFRCASTRVSVTFAAATFEQIHDVFSIVYLLHISFAYLIPSFYGGYVFGFEKKKFIQALPCEIM